jgi:hypothetical protein
LRRSGLPERSRARVLPELQPRSGPVGAPPRGSAGPTVVGARGRIYDHSVDNSVDNSVNNSINNSDTFHIAAKRVTVHRGQG